VSLLAEWRDRVRDAPDLDTTATVVAMVLSTYMNGEGRAYPSRATLAAGAKLRQPRTVDRAIRDLEAAGLLIVERSKGRRTSVYVATVSSDNTVVEQHRSEAQQGRLATANGVVSRTQQVRQTTHESSESEAEGFTAKEWERTKAGLVERGLLAPVLRDVDRECAA
jgi:hypothetical protein